MTIWGISHQNYSLLLLFYITDSWIDLRQIYYTGKIIPACIIAASSNHFDHSKIIIKCTIIKSNIAITERNSSDQKYNTDMIIGKIMKAVNNHVDQSDLNKNDDI